MKEDTFQPSEGMELAVRILAMPSDTNAVGDIFGGWIMSQVDIAGSVVAVKRAKGRIATVAVKEMQFKRPVFVGDLISCYAKVVNVGRTSITTRVEVCAHRNIQQIECIDVTDATIVYVALDKNGQPREVPNE